MAGRVTFRQNGVMPAKLDMAPTYAHVDRDPDCPCQWCQRRCEACGTALERYDYAACPCVRPDDGT